MNTERLEGAVNILPEVTEAMVAFSDCCGWTWRLSADPMSARQARSLLACTLGALGVPRDTVCDAELMVSELATNAYRHAEGHGPHELWLFPHVDPLDDVFAGPGEHEVVCAVFDGLPHLGPSTDSVFSGDFGRGLGIVAALSGGRWGTRPARSRLQHQILGKVVWFSCPVPCTVFERITRPCNVQHHGLT